MSLLIRRYREGDAESIRQLIRREFNTIGIPDPPALDSITEEDLDHIEERYGGRGGFWVAEVDGEIVGTIAIFEQLERPETAKLKRMVVNSKYQGGDIARLLFEQALEHARSAGYCKIWLSTRRVMVRAHRFYEKNGFSKVGSPPDHEYYFERTI